MVVAEQAHVNPFAGLFRTIGTNIGGMFGPKASEWGGKAGDLLAKVTGFGDYKVNGNTLMSGQPPSFMSSAQGTRITHREFLTDVTGSTDFTNTTLAINPGMATTFPWLSQVAAYFEQYEMKGLIFEFRPTSGVSATNPALGTVILATQYDPYDPPFGTKQQMDSYEFASSTVPYQAVLHPVECAPKERPTNVLYTRSGVSSGDTRLYDIGTLNVATKGMPSAYVVGEVWVSYDVVFYKPRINTFIGGRYVHIEEFPDHTASATSSFGTSGGQITAGSASGIVTIVSSNNIRLSVPGYYLIFFQQNVESGGGTLSGAPTISAVGANIEMDTSTVPSGDYPWNDGAWADFNTYDAVGGVSMVCALLYVKAAGTGGANNVTFTGSAGLTVGSTDCFIFPINYMSVPI
jgi:hypothetical protein